MSLSYAPRSVPLPIPIPQGGCLHGNAQRIYNLLSIAANCIEEYENPERGHIGDAATNGNLSEFEGCLESAITHWLFLFEAESLVDEETQIKIRNNIQHNAKYKAEREKKLKIDAMMPLKVILQRIEDVTHSIEGEEDKDYSTVCDSVNVMARKGLCIKV